MITVDVVTTTERRRKAGRGALPAVVAVLVGAFAAAGCGAPPSTSPADLGPADVPADSAAGHDAPRIVFLGDSLTAGYGLSQNEAYPALIGERLRAEGYPHEVVNAGISGDTSAGGLRRLDWSLRGDVRVLVLALGANDGLRGLPPSELQRNLGEIITRARAKGARVLLAGMEAPPNLGPLYTRDFRRAYAEVAREHGVTLVPFLLEGVAGMAALNQGDGIHPTAEGQRRIADTLWPHLTPLLSAGAGT